MHINFVNPKEYIAIGFIFVNSNSGGVCLRKPKLGGQKSRARVPFLESVDLFVYLDCSGKELSRLLIRVVSKEILEYIECSYIECICPSMCRENITGSAEIYRDSGRSGQ
jgi:hypothetical protein